MSSREWAGFWNLAKVRQDKLADAAAQQTPSQPRVMQLTVQQVMDYAQSGKLKAGDVIHICKDQNSFN